MKNNPFPIKQANTLNLVLDGDGNAFSTDYSDIYFQPNIGLDEKNHVFIQGNGLPKNWENRKHFTIAETGFGAGLNFLTTLQKWHETSNSSQHLHYISCELHPFNKAQLHQVLLAFPQLGNYTQQLLEKYPNSLFYGLHRLHFEVYNVTLTLIIGDAALGLQQLNAKVDAWYLDGFAPSKNPDLWSENLFKIIACLSRQGTTVATYSVAGKIRNYLQAVGFLIRKVKGFGQKREMLAATMQAKPETLKKQPWSQTFKANKAKTYTIVGAGIAGLTLAHKLCEAGEEVILIDRQKQPCQETSGNPQAMIMPSFTLNDSIEARFYLSAFLYAIGYYSSSFFHNVGVYELGYSVKQKIWQNELLQNFDLPASLLKQYQDGLLYTSAGWLDTQGHAKNILEYLQQQTNFSYKQAKIEHISYNNQAWHLIQDDKTIQITDCLVLSNGIGLKKLLPNYDLPITPKHGQISYFKSKGVDKVIAECSHIQLAKGYITPSWQGEQTMGATFDYMDESEWFKSPQPDNNHWHRNTELWNSTPYAKILTQITSYKSRVGVRVTTADHLPICGAVIDQAQFKKDYHDIKHGKTWKYYPQPKHINNLYVFTGLGSRGFTSAPILAELLCNQILGTPQVLDDKLQKAINPSRFLFRAMKKACVI